jgi:glycosyltransferase involved in cell wall biosynthesis
MNILEVVEACLAGVGRHVQGLSKGLVDRGHRVTVAYSPGRVDEAFRQFLLDHQREIRFIPLIVEREVSAAADMRSILQLMRIIRREGPFDVVHGHSSKGGAIARIAGRRFGLPTVYTPNSLVISSPAISTVEAAVYTHVERFLGHWATSRIIAVSEEEREFLLELGLVPHEHVALVENGIDDRDFEHFAVKHPPREEVSNECPLVFGALMRFSPQKAPGQLVEAFSLLDAALPRIPMRLVIAGDGELFAEVRRQVEASGLSGKIFLPGWETDTRKMLLGFDVYVLSSLFEGGAYTIIEAMAAKLPIVSTDVFGTGGTVARVTGNIVIPKGNPDALADGMRRVATRADPRSLRRVLGSIGQANHDYAGTRFRQSETTRRTLAIYRALR